METVIQLSSLDRHFADFIIGLEERMRGARGESGQPDRHALWLAAALASAAGGQGHTCCPLGESADLQVTTADGAVPFVMPQPAEWQTLLAGCDVVGRPGDYLPLVLDDDGRLYLHRSWSWERQIADSVRMLGAPLATELSPAAEAVLDRFFPVGELQPDMQRVAARTALTHGFTVISGGPGTGKTTTVARILAAISLTSTTAPRIALAAPTGKAALRLQQSLEQALQRLDLTEEAREALQVKACTIHRLLGVIPKRVTFRHNHKNPLPHDLLVVDEASMVDLPLMARLLEAVRCGTRVIMLGDRNQLASVEAGAVLADICESGSGQTGVPAVVELDRSYRFGPESGIGRLSRLVNAGDAAGAVELLTSGSCPDLIWRPLPVGRPEGKETARALALGYAGYGELTDPRAALDSLERFRILSPLREGPWGVTSLNRICQETLGLRTRGGQRTERLLPLMVSGNDYELGLFNGDTGVVMESPSGTPSAWFDDASGGLRHVSLLRLPAYETAFALTVHKSQGSEFDRLLLILPECGTELISRELLYTAITRARTSVEIWGDPEVIRSAVERCVRRASGLRDMLERRGAS